MKFFNVFLAACLLPHLPDASAAPPRGLDVMLILGAAGSEEYGSRFAEQARVWKDACARADVPVDVIGDVSTPSADANDIEALRTKLQAAAAQSQRAQLWLVWIGHGTYDGREAKFNLRGPDVTAKQAGDWLRACQRELVIVQTASASAPFLSALSGKGRTIVTATKGADEVFYARFGEYFAPAIAGSAEADLDKDAQVSVLEAFRHAARKVSEFYEQEGRLATEHALIEDNGDGVGTRAEAFAAAPATTEKKAELDGARASQLVLVLSPEEAALSEAVRARRDALETQLQAHRARRTQLSDDEYYATLEKLLRELADLYHETP